MKMYVLGDEKNVYLNHVDDGNIYVTPEGELKQDTSNEPEFQRNGWGDYSLSERPDSRETIERFIKDGDDNDAIVVVVDEPNSYSSFNHYDLSDAEDREHLSKLNQDYK